ncbi:hypothetical protein J1N35_003849 [Gossypium stocksii]|uniref:R13L1/DRL21-like LRR repeat region domain-containing protein n=1 Tax=Gossypium stocksii TaxID=47602 RepID=A0A9D3W9Z2_9ROSI|nr:hypothetical protein J1N35_003849 [Gossypium stocksii]
MKAMSYGIGKLTDLRRLSDFILGAGDGYRLRELKNLHLKGDLSLSGLENVVEARDALEAKLIDKPGLDALRLIWSSIFGSSIRDKVVEEEVLNMLEPYRDLKVLVIENYGVRSFRIGLQILPLKICGLWISTTAETANSCHQSETCHY